MEPQKENIEEKNQQTISNNLRRFALIYSKIFEQKIRGSQENEISLYKSDILKILAKPMENNDNSHLYEIFIDGAWDIYYNTCKDEKEGSDAIFKFPDSETITIALK